MSTEAAPIDDPVISGMLIAFLNRGPKVALKLQRQGSTFTPETFYEWICRFTSLPIDTLKVELRKPTIRELAAKLDTLYSKRCSTGIEAATKRMVVKMEHTGKKNVEQVLSKLAPHQASTKKGQVSGEKKCGLSRNKKRKLRKLEWKRRAQADHEFISKLCGAAKLPPAPRKANNTEFIRIISAGAFESDRRKH